MAILTNEVTDEFELELTEKITKSHLSLADVLMVGFACGRMPNTCDELFECMLGRKLTHMEGHALEDLEAQAYHAADNTIGIGSFVLEAVVSAR
jgi:hypothetical protein